jgi:aromatic ring hydroxylase
LAGVAIPAIYTAWYNGAPTVGNTNGQITGGTASGYEYLSSSNFDSNNTRINEDIDKYVQFENRVLGLARLRQLRVK